MRVCLCVVAVVGTGVSDWKGKSGLGGRSTSASHSAQPEWGGRGGVRRGMAQRKCSVGLHNTRGERAATRRRQPQGVREWAASAAAAAATAAARPTAGRRHEGRSLRARRHRERAQGRTPAVCAQWRRVGRVQPPVRSLGPERRPEPTPSAPAANRPRGRILVVARRHSQGSEGWLPRWSRAKEDGWGRRRGRQRPQRPNPGIGHRFRAGLDGTEPGPCASVADPDGRFPLLMLVANFPCVASRPSPPPPLRRRRPSAHCRRRPPFRRARRVRRECAPPPPAAAAESWKGWGTSS